MSVQIIRFSNRAPASHIFSSGTSQDDFLGSTFGNLRVLAYVGTRAKRSYYRCRCLFCGQDRIAAKKHLRSGRITACVDCARQNPHPPETLRKGGVYSR